MPKRRCSLAAFCCILGANQRGFYLSDCNFYNLGVLLTDNAEEHHVVIIDADGIMDMHPERQWEKSEISRKIMRKFWKHCEYENTTNEVIQQLWHRPISVSEILEEATQLWQAAPLLTRSQASSSSINANLHCGSA